MSRRIKHVTATHWSVMNSMGERRNFGPSMFREIDALKVVSRGELLELDDGFLLDSELTVIDYFNLYLNE